MIPRLKEKYKNEIVKNLMSKLNQKNIYSVPRIKKVVINMGLGADGSDQKKLKSCINDIAAITGQYPVVTKFKKSISNFKSRKGTNAGLKVTLRNDRMFEFIDRLVNIALPRIKDFRGLMDSGCDKFGNYSFGIKEHIIFPEINFDKVETIRGLDITIVTDGKSPNETIALLKEFNFPIVKNTTKKNKKVKKFNVEKITENKEDKEKNG
tara:strand:- start:6274 stop:6900 length:627 start_codon:yes stop_codon:yes gene_type:complete